LLNGLRVTDYNLGCPSVRVEVGDLKKPPGLLEQLRATAVHEAGHAVIARIIGWGFELVTIVPGESNLGHLALAPAPDHIQDALSADGFYLPEDKKWAAQKALLCASGTVAERIAGFIGEDEFWNEETRLAVDFARSAGVWSKQSVNDPDSAIDIDFSPMDKAVEKLLRHHWKEVEILTEELLNKRTLGAQEVRVLLLLDQRPPEGERHGTRSY
jgi:ATP-dependent Zn protease